LKLPSIVKDPLYEKAMEACKRRNEEYIKDFLLDVFYQHFTKSEYSDFTDDEKELMAYGLLNATSSSPQQ
jgi:hypothetical protein